MRLNQALSQEYLSQIKNLHIKAKIILQGTIAGLHNSPFHGYSSEFYQFKNYTWGDDIKYFDWKVFGKSEKTVIKQFRDETNANVNLIIDNSASMGFTGGGKVTKLEYVSVLAATTALKAFQQRDPVSLTIGARSPETIIQPKSSASHLHQIFNLLDQLQPQGSTNLNAFFQQTAPFLKRGSMTYIFTDLWQDAHEIVMGLRNISHKHQAVTLVCVLAPEEYDFYYKQNLELVDMESGLKLKIAGSQYREQYQEIMNGHRAQIRTECRKYKIKFIELNTLLPFHKAMRQVLSLTRP